MDYNHLYPNLIEIFTETSTALHIIITSSTSLVDMVSNIGGTLGLFAGFSILSGVEILFWGTKFIVGKSGSKTKNKKRKHLPKIKSESKKQVC